MEEVVWNMKIFLQGNKTWWRNIPKDLIKLGVKVEKTTTLDNEPIINLTLPDEETLTLASVQKIKGSGFSLLGKLFATVDNYKEWSWRFGITKKLILQSWGNNLTNRKFFWEISIGVSAGEPLM
jgi:hypothetical protein